MHKKAVISIKILAPFFLLSYFSIISSVQAQDSLHVDTLVAYYPFSGSAMDSSGFGNDGEVFGATLTEDRFGNPNSAYAFDGYDDYINTNTTINYPNRSVSVWVKVDYDESTVQNRQTILDQDSGDLEYGAMGLYFRNQLFDFKEGNAGDTWPQPELQKDTWYHLTMTRSDSVVKGFLNGQLIGTGIAGNIGSFSHPFNEVRVGANRELNYFLQGAVDDIRFYNYALPDSAIKELYTKGGWPLPQEPPAILADTLIAYYPFSGSAMDSSGFGNDGEVFGASLTEDRFGNPNSAYAFDGYNDFIEVSDDTVFNSVSKTIEFWFKKDINSTSTSDVQGIIWKALNTGKDRVFSYTVTNQSSLYDFYSNSGNQSDSLIYTTSEQSIYPGLWYQGVGVIDSSVVKLYLNGALVDSVIHNGGTVNNSAPIAIGKTQGYVPGFAGGTRHFEGAIDDISIYNYALSDSAIQKLYTKGDWPLPEDTTSVLADTLIAYYPFSGSAMDSSGFANDGEVFGATLTEDRFGNANSAYSFDGYDDFIQISDDSVFNSQSKTIEFWFKKDINSTSSSDVEGIIWKALNTGTDREFSYTITNQNSPYDFYSNSGNQTDLLVRAVTEQSIYPGRWYQGVGVIDSSVVKLYLNGVMVDSVVHYGGIVNNSAPIAIGKTQGYVPGFAGGTRHFEGAIDDIGIYNYALSDSAIQKLYTKGGWPLPKDTTSVLADTLIAYYPFSGSAMDSSGFANDGEVFGATLTEDRFGNANSAYQFKGNEYIDFGHTRNLNFGTKDFSVSVWIKAEDVNNDQYQILRRGLDVGTYGEARWALSLNNEGLLRVVFEDVDHEESWFIRNGNKNLFDNKWHHILAVFDRDSSLNVYVDSELDIYGPEVTTFSGDIVNSDSLNMFAGRGYKDDPKNDFHGSIDDIGIYNYALSSDDVEKLFDQQRVTSITDELESLIPEQYHLYQNYPNPFNPSTNIKFDLPQSGFVSLKVFDISGRLVSTLVNEVRPTGAYTTQFDASHLASGIYLYKLSTKDFSMVKKLTLIK